MMNTAFAEWNGTTEPSRGTPAVERVARVLAAVSDADSPPGISDLARSTGMGKSTVHALVVALTRIGFLRAHGGRYVLGPWLTELGSRAALQTVVPAAGDVLAALSATTGETAFCGRLEGRRVVILAVQKGRGDLTLSATAGSTVPAGAAALHDAIHCLESDPAQAAFASGAERDSYLPGIAACASAFRWAGDIYLVWTVAISAAVTDDQLTSMGAATEAAAGNLRALLTAPASIGARRTE